MKRIFKNTRTNFTNTQPTTPTVKIERNTREEYFLDKKIDEETRDSSKNYYLNFGGIGDAILLLSSCYQDPKAKCIFFCNEMSFSKEIFEVFNTECFLYPNIMGKPIAKKIFNKLSKLVKPSAHLADDLNYDDWKDTNKYIPRINNTNFIEYFGRKTQDKILILAPHGSFRSKDRQKYLEIKEYNQIIKKYLDEGYKIYSIGSQQNYEFYKIPYENCYWLTSKHIYSLNSKQDSNLKTLFQYINSAEKVISVDTWVKTYSLLCNIPTTVIRTRWNNQYKPQGEDIADWLFLNPNIWKSLTLTTISDLLPAMF